MYLARRIKKRIKIQQMANNLLFIVSLIALFTVPILGGLGLLAHFIWASYIKLQIWWEYK